MTGVEGEESVDARAYLDGIIVGLNWMYGFRTDATLEAGRRAPRPRPMRSLLGLEWIFMRGSLILLTRVVIVVRAPLRAKARRAGLS